MVLSFVRRCLPVVLLGLAACSVKADALPLPAPDAGAAGTVSFDEQGVLTAKPGEIVPIGITASAGVQAVQLTLLGDYADAALDRNQAATKDGHASVTLHAPTQAATFSIVAVAGVAAARLDVSVSNNGFVTLRVTPTYGGSRPVAVVAASTFLAKVCSDLSGKTVTDGAPLVPVSGLEPLVIDKVPADGHVAVQVRIGHYAVGCVDLDSLVPDTTRDVAVKVVDLPLDLASTDLETLLTFTPAPADKAAWLAVASSASDSVLASFLPSQQQESAVLLDAMAAAAGNDASAFTAARQQNGWDTTVGAHLGAHLPTIHDRVATWLADGLPSTLGNLTAHLVTGQNKGEALLSLYNLGPMDAADAGVTAPAPFAWQGDTEDVVHLQGGIAITPSRMVGAAADIRAHIDAPSAQGVPDALATLIDCDVLGKSLAGNGYAYGQCDASCVSGLCSDGLASRWSSAVAVSQQDSMKVAITASAPVTVGEYAEPDAFAGTWVGQVTAPNVPSFASKGAAKANHGTLPN